jgi:hypothetical protein
VIRSEPRDRVVLYLDFDGVLHGGEVGLDARRRPYLLGPGMLFEYADRLATMLGPYPDVDIVLSTSWVRIKGYRYACKRLPAALQQRVIGATWHSRFAGNEELRLWWMGSASRYDQIVSDVSRRRPAHWLALDDDAEGWPARARRHLIQCDPVLGLGESRVQGQLASWLADPMD